MSQGKKYRDRKKLTLTAAGTKTRPDESPGGGGRERTVGSNERGRRNCDVIRPRHPQRTTTSTTTTTTWRRSGVRRRDTRSSRLRPGSELSLVRMKTTVTEFTLGGCGLLGLSEGESDGQWRGKVGQRQRESYQEHDDHHGDEGADATDSRAREEWSEGVKYRSKTFISHVSGADPASRTPPPVVVPGWPPSPPYQLLEIQGTPRPELPPTHPAAGQDFYKNIMNPPSCSNLSCD